MDSRHLPLLRLAGLVLVIAGLVDIAALAYSLSQGTDYPAGWGLFALASGALVFRGSLLAAFVVRWVACLALAASMALLLGMPMMQPFSLTFTQLRLNQGPTLDTVAITTAVLALLAWLVWQLGRAPIRAARQSAGLPQRSMLVPVLAGVAMVIVLAVFLVSMRIGTTANNAKILAEQATMRRALPLRPRGTGRPSSVRTCAGGTPCALAKALSAVQHRSMAACPASPAQAGAAPACGRPAGADKSQTRLRHPPAQWTKPLAAA
jgi:hypothetical protein